MNDQKIENLLNLALEATEKEREASGNLKTGYDPKTGLWDVIVKYSGPEEGLAGENIRVTPLLGGYAVVTLPQEEIAAYAKRPQTEFIEMPKRLYFQVYQGKTASCITGVQQAGSLSLTGLGILVGIVDSGVDYRHPAFRNPDGSSRILRLWDQSIPGNPPAGYQTGTEYTKEEIDRALALPVGEGRRLVPSVDASGHGTAVLGIAAGSSDDPRYRGVAFESGLLVVKMGAPRENSFPRTTELLLGIDYLVRQAQALGQPMALNLSFGNNYGSHRGDSLTETYLDNVSNIGRLCICTGTGNNGEDALHASGAVQTGETREIQLAVGGREPTLNVQLWKAFEDEMEIWLENPSGDRIGPLEEISDARRYVSGNTELLVYYGKPAPYHVTQEIYVDFLPAKDSGGDDPASGFYVDGGTWRIILKGRRIRDGRFDLWLPGGNVLNRETFFLIPEADGTLTIPSTSRKVITAAAYDSRLDAPAGFSGRGSAEIGYRKPDFAAPGVDITAPRPGGGYASFTGTSFAVPFAAGACALLMQWGIADGNDPYLYAEKAKAALRRGARPLPGTGSGFDLRTGFGALCLKEAVLE